MPRRKRIITYDNTFGWGGARIGAGRPKKVGSRPGASVTVYLCADELEYLDLACGSRQAALRACIETARLFRKGGV